MTSCNHDAVIQTARDALQAKQSALVHGLYAWDPQYDRMLREDECRRQTALVNAGYAVRVACTVETVRSFLKFHSDSQKQVVILGAGLDVLGLWASLFAETVVVEIDLPSVAKEKTDMIKTKHSQLFAVSSNYPMRSSYRIKKSGKDNFHVVAADLNDVEALDLEMEKCLDRMLPTLVVSELVLAYLDEPVGQLLAWCKSSLCQHDQSVMFAFEPVGFTREETTLASYTDLYHSHFEQKLQGGKTETSSSFRTVGSSGVDCEAAFLSAGFESAMVCRAGAAAEQLLARLNTRVYQTKDVFDEHVALSLHLESYAIVRAFGKSRAANRLFRESLLSPVTPKQITRCNITFFISSLDIHDEGDFRDLFESTYDPYIPHHPTIGKMVKAALLNDLAPSLGIETSSSYMRHRYSQQGGEFLVAIGTEGGFLGGMAVRPYTKKEVRSRRLGKGPYIEIHRLLVRPQFCKLGIASELLCCVEDMYPSHGIIATCPTILMAANVFYKRRGFVIHREQPMRSLVMRTFLKSCP